MNDVAQQRAALLVGLAWAQGGLYRLSVLENAHASEAMAYCRGDIAQIEAALAALPGVDHSSDPSVKAAHALIAGL